MLKQTLLRVLKPQPSNVIIPLESTELNLINCSNITINGNGFIETPYNGSIGINDFQIEFEVTNRSIFHYVFNFGTMSSIVDAYERHKVTFEVEHDNGFDSGIGGFTTFDSPNVNGTFIVERGDKIRITGGEQLPIGSYSVFITPLEEEIKFEEFDYLDLYDGIPIRINKSYAELQNVGARNSDFSIGLRLPGTKKNNRFFENYFDVDVTTLFFDVTKITPCEVLVDNERYFKGFMKLNTISIMEGMNEYDVTLYSTVGDLLGKIGTNLLKDLDYDDIDYHFNHYFNLFNVAQDWMYNTSMNGKSVQSLYTYPIVHNGYEYDDEFVSVETETRLYTPTVIDTFNSQGEANANGYLDYRINSVANGLFNNQLKPALNIWGLTNLMFKTYGYSIKSEFMNTPWFKKLYMYGIYSSDNTRFSFKISNVQNLPLGSVQVVLDEFIETVSQEFACNNVYNTDQTTLTAYVVRSGTGIPATCSETIRLNFFFTEFTCFGSFSYQMGITIPAGQSSGQLVYISSTFENCFGCPLEPNIVVNGGLNQNNSNVTVANRALSYLPGQENEDIPYIENDYVNFSQLIDNNIKQIDILSSIAKKFNLVMIENPDVENEIIIEPYDYFIGTGQIYDWSDKLSFTNGYTVQPANNFIESELIISDLEDFDDGNQLHKRRNNRIYGEKLVINPTDFKSETKVINTNLAPNSVRKWYTSLNLPLSINYTEQTRTREVGNSEVISYQYRSLRSKPKILVNIGVFPLATERKVYNITNFATIFGRLKRSNDSSPGFTSESFRTNGIPVFGNTTSIGMSDEDKINNDNFTVLFNGEEPLFLSELGAIDFEQFTNNDAYELFYSNRINNMYNKDTRVLGGNFDLKINDVKQLQPKDLIKIKNKLFSWNKIDAFDVMNNQLTRVELIQYNNVPRVYPIRYFKYRYCGDSTEYRFRTYFNPFENPTVPYVNEKEDSLRRTYFHWSVRYDYIVGQLGVREYASSYQDESNENIFKYIITEIDEEEYDSIENNHYDDINDNLFINKLKTNPSTDLFQNELYIVIGNNYYLNYGLDCEDLLF